MRCYHGRILCILGYSCNRLLISLVYLDNLMIMIMGYLSLSLVIVNYWKGLLVLVMESQWLEFNSLVLVLQ